MASLDIPLEAGEKARLQPSQLEADSVHQVLHSEHILNQKLIKTSMASAVRRSRSGGEPDLGSGTTIFLT